MLVCFFIIALSIFRRVRRIDKVPVNYVLRGGELFNMVLLVPDDMPAGATTLEGNVEEMRALFKDWDPRLLSPSLPKLLLLIRGFLPFNQDIEITRYV